MAGLKLEGQSVVDLALEATRMPVTLEEVQAHLMETDPQGYKVSASTIQADFMVWLHLKEADPQGYKVSASTVRADFMVWLHLKEAGPWGYKEADPQRYEVSALSRVHAHSMVWRQCTYGRPSGLQAHVTEVDLPDYQARGRYPASWTRQTCFPARICMLERKPVITEEVHALSWWAQVSLTRWDQGSCTYMDRMLCYVNKEVAILQAV
eukprot:1161802-Pelagomonas_calceolata.AAC.18